MKENTKACITGTLRGESTDDRWIPFHKRPVTWKSFPFDDVNIRRCDTTDYHCLDATIVNTSALVLKN